MKKLFRVSVYIIKFSFAQILAFFVKLAQPAMRNVWLLSERGADARDNGYFFYKYLSERHPVIPAYYVIQACSSDADRIKPADRIEPNSFRHFFVFALCRVRLSSHAWGGDIPVADYYRRLGLANRSHKTFVFLQHGIIKDYQPGLCYPVIRPSLFVCGAEPEYEYIAESFHHPNHVVQYTGLSRFDSLEDAPKNQILVMPTFRKWLQRNNEQEFLCSAYYQAWQSFLASSELADKLESRNLDLIFYPHYELQKYIHLFHSGSKRIKIADFDHYDVQTLLKESKLLITDFSSVFFDFSYMRKPVIFYQFDRLRYISEHYDFTKGYFDYDTMAPGKVVFEETELLDEVRGILNADFAVDRLYLARRDNFFPKSDHNNCDRIFEAIQELR